MLMHMTFVNYLTFLSFRFHMEFVAGLWGMCRGQLHTPRTMIFVLYIESMYVIAYVLKLIKYLRYSLNQNITKIKITNYIMVNSFMKSEFIFNFGYIWHDSSTTNINVIIYICTHLSN